MNRRDALKAFAAVAAIGVAGQSTRVFAQAAPAAAAGPFSLPPVGYDYGALEPHIDTMTMTIHHQRHHGAYVNNLNALAKDVPELTSKGLDAVMADLSMVADSRRAGVRNNLGGHWNHVHFWDVMTPGGAKEPGGDLKAAIEAQLGGVQAMRERMTAAGLGRFGSGWAWLTVDKDKKLQIVSTPNQDNPMMDGARGVVVGVDVWEHAYYLKYQNRRNDYIAAWWNTVNWDKAAANYRKAIG